MQLNKYLTLGLISVIFLSQVKPLIILKASMSRSLNFNDKKEALGPVVFLISTHIKAKIQVDYYSSNLINQGQNDIIESQKMRDNNICKHKISTGAYFPRASLTIWLLSTEESSKLSERVKHKRNLTKMQLEA